MEQTLVDVKGYLSFGPPKTKAARGTIALPGFLVEELARHLEGRDLAGLVFTSENGTPLRASNFRRRVWNPAVSA